MAAGRPLAVVAVLAALGVSGCGGSGGAKAASRPSPASPIVVSVLAQSSGLGASPTRFGAGPVLLTVTNQGRHPITIQLDRRGRAVAGSPSIAPQGVTQLKVDLERGAYTMIMRRAGRRTDAQRTIAQPRAVVMLHVGAARPSSGSQLLQP